MMLVNVFNKAHFHITIYDKVFPPFKEINIKVDPHSDLFKQIRINKQLKVDNFNNAAYIKKHKLKVGKSINFCYDNMSQHAGEAYKYAIMALSDPIIKNIPEAKRAYSNRPLTKMNVRYFNSSRIREQGKCPVGPNDVFFSHGIGDKNYWVGPKISDFKYAFVPGPLWEKRMRDTGYMGEIFICGYTKLDPIINGEVERNKRNKPYVVWCPTHGYNSKHKGRSSYPQCLHLIHEIDPIYETKLAMHPTSKLHNKIKHTPTLNELLDADVVIADAGSTLYEAWILGKPVIFPGWICRKDVLNHFKGDKNNFEYQIYSKQIGYHAKDMQHLNKLIEVALNDGMKDEEKAFINSIYPEEIRGKAGKIAGEQLIELAKTLKLF